MKSRTLKRHFAEAFKSLGRNGWMSFASVSAVTVTLLLVGVFLVVLLNLNHLASQIEGDVEIRAYIDRTTKQSEYNDLQQKMEQIPNVNEVKFQSKEDGLQELIKSLGDEGKAFSSLKNENPLPDAFIIKTKKPQDTSTVASEIEKYDHIKKVDYGQGTVERLFKVTGVARNVGLVLIIGLIFTAMFLISNTIKLTILSRRKEIEIMKLVGATNGFIRWPYFIEGFVLGLMGSIIPILVVIFGYEFLHGQVNNQLDTVFVKLLPVYPMVLQLSVMLAVIGGLIGVWGSMTSVRKFLKV
ncbi:permease-like cell division protein FtsX [Fictibacillus enclensis]|uniref:permease-like cell division protein FtsX n=1 Tax=Fictibacillus enclensis TaxID=1017270 RepID=UPI0025A10266|nr:permease-like cell division protein FtsX [Fictibacillus enclensis]MDM5200673.1 permease-like cell division protein FtsX [Fictibacillus enclensis]